MLAVYALLPLLGLAAAAPIEKRWNRVRIRSGRDGKCLTAAPKTWIGAPVYTTDCANALLWSISPGSGSVLLGSSLALDAGENPHNNGKVKVWTSYPGLFQQTWYLTGDNRIAITGGDQCLDMGDNGVQTYQCTPYNDNQVWYVEDETGQPPSESPSPTPSASASATPSPSASDSFDPLPEYARSQYIFPDPKDGGRRIRLTGRNDMCVTVQGGYPGRGAAVHLCWASNDTFIAEQMWDMPEGTGQVKLHANPSLCLDAGDNPANDSGLKIYDCLDVPQQQWTLEGGFLKIKPLNLCLDVAKESTHSYSKPYVSLKDLQMWECSEPDVYQHFSLYDGPGNDGSQ